MQNIVKVQLVCNLLFKMLFHFVLADLAEQHNTTCTSTSALITEAVSSTAGAVVHLILWSCAQNNMAALDFFLKRHCSLVEIPEWV